MTILVPLDGSETAEAAVPVALRLARECQGGLVLLSVVSIRVPQDPSPVDPDLLRASDAKRYLEAVKSRLMSEAVNVITAVWSGTPATAIVSAAQASGAEFIVMSSHGRSGQQRDMFGSVADAVLREAPMQVVVVRPRRRSAGLPEDPRQTISPTPV